MSIGARIRAARTAKGLTQQRLAQLVGVRQTSISDLERGESKSPAASTLVALSRVLDVNHEWLVTGRGTMAAAVAPTIEEAELLAIWRELTPGNQAALIGAARGILASQPHEPSRTSPFPATTKGAVSPAT